MSERMDSYRINERARSLIIKRIEDLIAEGTNQRSISTMLGCDPATVNRWISNNQVPETISFRDMVRYLDRLRIALEDVFVGVPDVLPPPAPDTRVTELDKNIATTLKDVANALGKNNEEICRTLEFIDTADVASMLSGKEVMSAGNFYRLCKAVGVAPEVVLGRAGELLGEDEYAGGAPSRRSA